MCALLSGDSSISFCVSLMLSLLSSLVSHNIELVANAGSDRSWTWRTIDYATEEAEQQTFAIRFKDSESLFPSSLSPSSALP